MNIIQDHLYICRRAGASYLTPGRVYRAAHVGKREVYLCNTTDGAGTSVSWWELDPSALRARVELAELDENFTPVHRWVDAESGDPFQRCANECGWWREGARMWHMDATGKMTPVPPSYLPGNIPPCVPPNGEVRS